MSYFLFSKPVETAEEYIDLLQKFYGLVSSELNDAERILIVQKDRPDPAGMEELARHMPVLISLVNCIGYLRGQDGAFPRRPRTPEEQSKLYDLEDNAEKFLKKLIDAVMDSPAKQLYIDRLTSYFVKARSHEQPDV